MMNAPWDIVHLDLSRGLSATSTSERGVFTVLWWRDVPLGQVWAAARRTSLSRRRPDQPRPQDLGAQRLDIIEAITPALDAYLPTEWLDSQHQHRWENSQSMLQALLSPLDRVLASSGATDEPTVSVVVPTCDRPKQLAACLRSLAALQEEPLEILVVDNGAGAGSELTRRVAEDAGAIYIAESRRGSSAARNAGVAASLGDLIAFVDDDETVHPSWLGRLVQGFRDPKVALVTGLVLPAELRTEAQLIFERRYGFGRGYVARTFDADLYRSTRHRGVPVWEIGGSGNMAIRRDVFQQLGGFDERLGAGRAGGCEELELFYRTLAAGWSCHYEPRAVTHHRHRRNLSSLKQQLHAYMRGHVAAALTQWANHRDSGNLHHLLWTLPRVYAGYAVRSLFGDRTYRAGHLAAEISGCLAGIGYYRRHRFQAPPQVPTRPAAARA